MELATTVKFTREELEEILERFVTQFLPSGDDLSSSVCWNYTDEGDLDGAFVSVYTPEE